jgi:hypothetical protein
MAVPSAIVGGQLQTRNFGTGKNARYRNTR